MNSVIPAKAGIFSRDPSLRWGDGTWAGVTGLGLGSRDMGSGTVTDLTWNHELRHSSEGWNLLASPQRDGIKPEGLKRHNFLALSRFLYQKTF